MGDKLHELIIGVFNEGFKREAVERDTVRQEIKDRGTYWAGGEIWQLRRRIASLEARLQRLTDER
jgi:hypothetical protein